MREGIFMIVLNFAHPFTKEQLAQIQQISGYNVEKVFEIKTQFNHQLSFKDQVKKLVEDIPLQSDEWQRQRIIINPPSFSTIAIALLAELHGRMGYFPPIIRISPVCNTPPEYKVVEILNLQEIRDEARTKR